MFEEDVVDVDIKEESSASWEERKAERDKKYRALKEKNSKLEKAAIALGIISIASGTLAVADEIAAMIVSFANIDNFQNSSYYTQAHYEAVKEAAEKLEAGEYTPEEYNKRINELSNPSYIRELMKNCEDKSFQEKENASKATLFTGAGLTALFLVACTASRICDFKAEQNTGKMHELIFEDLL